MPEKKIRADQYMSSNHVLSVNSECFATKLFSLSLKQKCDLLQNNYFELCTILFQSKLHTLHRQTHQNMVPSGTHSGPKPLI